MKNNIKKISSVLLILFYLTSTLGFVLEQKNCICCAEKEVCAVENSSVSSCCAPKETVPSYCSPKAETTIAVSKKCNCDKIKCSTSEYLRNEHSSVKAKSDVQVQKLKNTNFVILPMNISENDLSFLTEIKSDPPPILFKDSSFIIKISKIKIPSANLV